VSAAVGDNCNDACANTPTAYYSNTSTPACGDYIYTESTCTECPSIQDKFVEWNDNGDCCVISKTCLTSFSDVCDPSDLRLKKNVETLENSLDKLLQLNPVEFDWEEITPEYNYFVEKGISHSIGFIAQQVRTVVPEIVQIKDNGYYTVDYPRVNALLVEGIKEQQVFIDELEKDIIDLEKYFNI
jgi:hypothetical protein